MKNNYLVINESVDPYYNLALEEYLLTHYMEGKVVMLWQNDNTIVVGRHQNAIEEINQQYVKEHSIKVVRRTTGGGAVYHDLGNLNYSFITDRDQSDDHGLKCMISPVIECLRSLGVDASFGGRNDILADGRKISGTAQRIYKNRILHHGCLLYDSDLEVLSKSLNVRPEKFHSKSVRSVRSRVGNVKELLDSPISLQEFKKYFIDIIMQKNNYHIMELDLDEIKQVKKRRNEKYAAWEWTYGCPIKCAIHNYRKYDGGSVEVYMNVANGLIKECEMYGDFMALRPASEVASALLGCRYQYEDVMKVLKKFRISDYFGSVCIKEVALSICCVEE